MAVVFLLCATAFAFFQVPYNALPAEMTTSPTERTRLTAWRIAVLAVAILISGAGAPALRDAVGGLAGYRIMGIAVGVLILVGAIAVFVGTARTQGRAAAAVGRRAGGRRSRPCGTAGRSGCC